MLAPLACSTEGLRSLCTGRDGQAEFRAVRIPGAQFFDIDGVSEKASALPHMLPSSRSFAAAMDILGITSADQVVLYDGSGMFSAPRAWWTFRAFGHRRWARTSSG